MRYSEATRRLMSVQSDLYGQKTRSAIPDWDFISSLLSGNSSLPGTGGRGGSNSMAAGAGKERDDTQQAEEVQYFPGKSQMTEGDATGAFVQLTSAGM